LAFTSFFFLDSIESNVVVTFFLFLWDEGFWVGISAILSPLSLETGTSILIACFFLSFFLGRRQQLKKKEDKLKQQQR